MKARILYAAPETNPGKLVKLEELYTAYRSYVQTCIDKMVSDKRPKVLPSERRTYFPAFETLSSQILKNAQMHAVQVVETWIKGRYLQKLKKVIREAPNLTDHEKMELRCCGKYLIKTACKFGKGHISQEMADLYWGWLWNPEIGGNPPRISEDFPILLTEMTCWFGPADEANHFGWWLTASTLVRGKTVKIPLAYNPYFTSSGNLAKTVFAKKREGRWTFQFCEKLPSEADDPFDGSAGKVGLDVGLNVLASTSDGKLYGRDIKPKFDKLYKRTKTLRTNRQRQDFKKDSKRLQRLETRLSGMIKTAVGTITNKLVKTYPSHTFVIEDLDLRGCRGQKRFAYRALHNSLSHKACIEAVNPAYSSQSCPSCGHISRNNRKGIVFHCRSCGRKSHADVIGGINLLGRSGDKQIDSCEDPSEVRSLLRERTLRKRNSSSGRFVSPAPKPKGRKLTTKVSLKEEIGTASNGVPYFLASSRFE